MSADTELPCNHRWVTRRAGGDPAEASSAERVTYCRHCGIEQSDVENASSVPCSPHIYDFIGGVACCTKCGVDRTTQLAREAIIRMWGDDANVLKEDWARLDTAIVEDVLRKHDSYLDVEKLPQQLGAHVQNWLTANQLDVTNVRLGVFPLGMVQRWIERADRAEAQRDELLVALKAVAGMKQCRNVPTGATRALHLFACAHCTARDAIAVALPAAGDTGTR